MEKSEIIDNYSFEPKNFVVRRNSKADTCVVYCLWSSNLYLKMLYFSLVSQIKFTNINDVDVKIFVSQYLNHKNIRPFGCDVVLMDGIFTKYSILSHPSLKRYKKVILVDTDLFFWAQKREIYNLFDDNVLVMSYGPETLNKASNIFYDRCRHLGGIFLKYKEYIELFSFHLQVEKEFLTSELEKRKWYISPFTVVPLNLLDCAEWQRITDCLASFGSWCDETAFMLLSIMRNIPIVTVSDYGIKFCDGSNTLSCIKNASQFVMLHPFRYLDEYVYNEDEQKLIHSVFEELNVEAKK